MRTVRSLLSDRCKKWFRKRTFIGLTPVTRVNTIRGKSPAFYNGVYVLVLFNHISVPIILVILGKEYEYCGEMTHCLKIQMLSLSFLMTFYHYLFRIPAFLSQWKTFSSNWYKIIISIVTIYNCDILTLTKLTKI